MESGYLWGGTLAGLALLVALGVVLAKNSPAFRAALAPYVGEQPARWLLYGAWFVYGYGLLFAVTQAYLPTLENTGIGAPPAALSFLYHDRASHIGFCPLELYLTSSIMTL